MKNLIFVITALMFSPQAFANEKIVTQLLFKNSSTSHRYTLVKESKKPAFKLIFQEDRKKPVAKLVSKSQADFIKNEATRIIWNSEYRKPANAQRCSEYVNIISGTEKANVCAENRKATAMTYGLLNSVSRIFGIK